MTGQHRGILLAGGRGTRLYPLTAVQSKQLVAVFNKPMVYYSLSVLMLSGIREIALISTPESLPAFEALLGDGSQWGIAIEYLEQAEPRGIADALLVAEDFVGDRPSMLMLGDNVLYGRLDFLRDAVRSHDDDAVVFAYRVSNPSDYGIVEFDRDGKAIRLEEKPAEPRSNWAVPGIYIYPAGAPERVHRQRPSDRGELEITDLNRSYLEEGRLLVVPMGRGVAWFDTGTPNQLLEASNFIEAIESRQGLAVGCPEEVAYRMDYVDAEGMARLLESLPAGPYRDYLMRVVDPSTVRAFDAR